MLVCFLDAVSAVLVSIVCIYHACCPGFQAFADVMLLCCRLGRKILFAEGGLQMFICFIVVAAVMGSSFNKVTGYIPRKSATTILAFECLYTAGFAWSWGPLGWLVPSEFHNIETRGTGQAITVCVNFLFSFVIGQCYLTMLCQ